MPDYNNSPVLTRLTSPALLSHVVEPSNENQTKLRIKYRLKIEFADYSADANTKATLQM